MKLVSPSLPPRSSTVRPPIGGRRGGSVRKMAGQGVSMKQASLSLSLPSLPPLKGGEVVKVDEGLYALILKPLVDEPGAYKSVPFKERPFEMIPVDLLVHEELIKEVVGRAHPLLLEVAREAEKHPVGFLRAKDDEVLRKVIAVQWGSEFCLTEPWERVVVCRKATILISKGADVSLLKFSRFGEASLRELPDGRLEVALTAGAAYFKGAPVKVFVGGEEVLLEEDEDLVLYVRGDESLPEARAIF